MNWNYRLIRHKDSIGLHEVYYEDGKPVLYTEEPVFSVDPEERADGMIKELKNMLEGAKERIIDIKEFNNPSKWT
jgi:hypothetical protein